MQNDVEYPPFIDEEGSDERLCPRCNEVFSSAYPDACLGFIPGASEACCGHGIIYHDEDEISGTEMQEGQGYICFPPDDPNYLNIAGKNNIFIEFPRLTDPERIKAVGFAVAKTLGRDQETFRRNPFKNIEQLDKA